MDLYYFDFNLPMLVNLNPQGVLRKISFSVGVKTPIFRAHKNYLHAVSGKLPILSIVCFE